MYRVSAKILSKETKDVVFSLNLGEFKTLISIEKFRKSLELWNADYNIILTITNTLDSDG